MADGDSASGMNLGGGVNGVDSKDGDADKQENAEGPTPQNNQGSHHGGDQGWSNYEQAWGQPQWDDSWWYNDSYGWNTVGGINAILPNWAHSNGNGGSPWQGPNSSRYPDGSQYGYSCLVTDGKDEPVAPESKRRRPVDKKRVKFTDPSHKGCCKGKLSVCNVDTKGDDEFEWVEEEAIVDSGTVDNLGGPEHVDSEDVVQTDFSRKGGKYLAASDDPIKNIGQGAMDAQDANGMPLNSPCKWGIECVGSYSLLGEREKLET